MSREHPRPRYNLIIFCAIAVLYSALAIYFAGQDGAYWASEQGYNRIASESVRLFPPVNLSPIYPGQWLDATYNHLPFAVDAFRLEHGQPFLLGAPVFWLLNKPLIALFGDAGVMILPLLAGLVNLWLLACLLKAFVPRNAIAVGLLLAGLGTPLFIYSLSYSEHSLASALLLAGLLPWVANEHKARWQVWVLSALACSLAAVFRKEVLWIMGVMAIALIMSRPRQWKHWLLWGGVVMLVLGLEALGNYLSFGWPFPLEYWLTIRRLYPMDTALAQQGIGGLLNLIFDSGQAGVFLLVAAGVYALGSFIPRDRMRDIAQALALAGFGAGVAMVVFNKPLETGLDGFLSAVPFLLLGLAWPQTASRSLRTYYFLVWVSVVLILIARGGLTLTEPPREGLQWGARSMLPVFILAVPLVMVAFVALWERVGGSWQAKVHLAAAVAVVALGFLIQIRGLGLITANIEQQQSWAHHLESLPENEITTNQPWLAAALPNLYSDKDFFLINQQHSLYDWIEAAYLKDIQTFVFVGDYAISKQDLNFIALDGGRVSIVETRPLDGSLFLTRLAIDRNAANLPVFDLTPIAAGLQLPTYLTATNDGSGRLFVLESFGRIRIIQNNQLLAEPFLDITHIVANHQEERGLLSMVFAPDYGQSGRFWVTYSTEDALVLARYSVSSDLNQADPDSAEIILTIPHPGNRHYGGQLQFGPDGYLYMSSGDGGYGDDTPALNGQRLNVLLGKLLRIDVSGSTYEVPPDNPFVGQPDARPEIWAYGLRNPWRFSFDPVTHDLYLPDVGEAIIEEINIQPAGSPGGENYGWNNWEGSRQNMADPILDVTLPVVEINHDVGFCAIIGGYAYRGSLMPALMGDYIFSDYCTGQIWALHKTSAGEWEPRKLLDTPIQITSFGEDASGEIYVLDIDGAVYRLTSLSE